MHSTLRSRCLCLASLSLLTLLSPLSAATYIWKGGGGDNYWSNEDNWVGGHTPDEDADEDFTELIFPAAAQSHHTVCDWSYFYADRIIFRGSYTVSHTDNGDDNVFGMGAGPAPGIYIDSAAAPTVVFDNTTKFVADSPITLSSGTLKFQGFVTIDGLISGSGDVSLEGFKMSGICLVTGVTVHLRTQLIKAITKFNIGAGGTLSVEDSSQINGAEVSLDNAGMNLAAGVFDSTGPLRLTNNASINALAAGAGLQFNDTVTCADGSNYLLGHFLLGGKTREMAVLSDTALLTMSGPLEDGSGLVGTQVVNTGGIKKTGPGTLRVNSAGTFHGPVTVSEGELQAFSATAFGAAGGSVSVTNGATLSLNGINVPGETLTLGGRLTVPAGTSSWTGNISLSSTAKPIEMKPAPEVCYLKHSGILSGAGTLGLEGGGTLELAGAGSNTYTGETVLKNGIIRLHKTSGNAIPGPLTIDPYTYLIETRVVLDADNQIADDAMILLDGQPAILDLSNHDETIGALLSFAYGAGEVRLGNSRTGTATFTTGTNNLNTSYSGTITGAPGMTLVKSGTGTFQMISNNPLKANTYTGQTLVTGGTLTVDVNQEVGDVTVKTGATLGGQGKTGVVLLDGGNLALGHLNTGNVSSNFTGGKYHAALLGAAPQANGYDQLQVTGAVNLTNTTLTGTLGFTPGAGAKFVIIQNDGSEAVTGQFTGLAEGGNLNIGGKPFSISYHGGDGNDVELKYTGTGGPPRILTISYNRAQDKVHLEALAPPGVLCYWQVSGTMGGWSNFSSGVPDAAGLLKLDQTVGLHADRLFFRLMQP